MMKKIAIIVTVLLIVLGTFLCFSTVYAKEAAIDEMTESQLVQIKSDALNSLADYQEKYGSDIYGLVAYILNLVRIYSIPLCFLGIAIGAKNGKAYQSTNDPRGGKTAQSRGLCISDRNNLYRA